MCCKRNLDVKSVTLYRPGESTPQGDPLEVNPAQVGCIEAHPISPAKCLLNIFGQKYTVRGTREEISRALGWEAAGEAENVQAAAPKLKAAASDDEL